MPFVRRTHLLSAVAALTLAAGASAQVLARPGWAGSGVAPEPWWRRAVLYRLDPARFQDSDGDGRGDLKGLVARLDYLQSLGIDGLLLEAAEIGNTPDAPGFGEVVREGSRRGMRLLIALPAADPSLAADGRRWLNAGAAGIYLMRPLAGISATGAGATASAASVRELRQVAASFPGERILAADPGAIESAAEHDAPAAGEAGSASAADPYRPIDFSPKPIQLGTSEPDATMTGPRNARHRRGRGRRRHAEGSGHAPAAPARALRGHDDVAGRAHGAPVRAQLTATARLLPPPAASGAGIGVASLRSALLAANSASNQAEGIDGAPLLRLPLTATATPVEPRAAALWRTLATIELASRGAAVIEFGAEIGLNTGADASPDATADTAAAAAPPMQWTPRNRTLPPPAPPETASPAATPAPAGSSEPVYGAYHPYVRPPKTAPPAAAAPKPAVASTGADTAGPAPAPAAAPVDPDTLAGFTRGDLSAPPVQGAELNVAVEDAHPDSLLNFYRRLIALHHDSAALRHGAVDVLDLSAVAGGEQTLAWIRRAPAGSRTAQTVLIVCNLGADAVTLNLNPELTRLRLRPGALRELLTSSPVPLTGEGTQKLQLPADTVLIGEVVP